MSSSIAGTSLETIAACATSAFSAQVLKVFINWVIKRPFDFRTLVHTGGMPSSHSALVACLATSVGLISGFDSTVFTVALGFSAIVMYDAAGLRQAAGKMAGILNKISNDIYQHRSDYVPVHLRELLGHTPFEVIVGAFLGMVVAYIYHVKLAGG